MCTGIKMQEHETARMSQELELLVGAELAQVVDDVLNLQAVHRCGVIEALGVIGHSCSSLAGDGKHRFFGVL
jgi:hypothetical protein